MMIPPNAVHIQTSDLHFHLITHRIGAADGDLDALCGQNTDHKIVVFAHVLHDGIIKLITAHPDTVGVDTVIPNDLVAIGEVGLTGEIRSVSNMNQRLSEVSRLGFKTCIIPRNGSEKLEIPDGLQAYRVRNIREAIEMAM